MSRKATKMYDEDDFYDEVSGVRPGISGPLQIRRAYSNPCFHLFPDWPLPLSLQEDEDYYEDYDDYDDVPAQRAPAKQQPAKPVTKLGQAVAHPPKAAGRTKP